MMGFIEKLPKIGAEPSKAPRSALQLKKKKPIENCKYR